jgi:hypothetical protein
MFCCKSRLDSIGSRTVYELDRKKPILYVIPKQNILGAVAQPFKAHLATAGRVLAMVVEIRRMWFVI